MNMMKRVFAILMTVLLMTTFFPCMIVSNARAIVASATLNKFDFVVTVVFTAPVDCTYAVFLNIYIANIDPWQNIDGGADRITMIDDKTVTIKFTDGAQVYADYDRTINLVLGSGCGIYDVATDMPIERVNISVQVIDDPNGTPTRERVALTSTSYQPISAVPSGLRFSIETKNPLNNADILLAIYDADGSLLLLKQIACDGSDLYAIDVPQFSDVTVKIFVWSSIDEMEPLGFNEIIVMP